MKNLISFKGEDMYKFMTMDRINQIRNQFYSILLELFAHYSQFVGKDQMYNDVTFNVRAFISFGENKAYKDFYNSFFYANTEKQEKLNNQVFLNFIAKQNVASGKEAQTCSIMHFNESIMKF